MERALVLIAVRVHALYDLVPRIKWFLGIYWLITATMSMILTIRQMVIITREIMKLFFLTSVSQNWMSLYKGSAVALPQFKVCTPGFALPKDYFTIWIPAVRWILQFTLKACWLASCIAIKLCFETTMFIMTMFKLIKLKRTSRTGLGRLLLRWSHNPCSHWCSHADCIHR